MRNDGLLLLGPDDVAGLLDVATASARIEAELLSLARNRMIGAFREHVGLPDGAFHIVGGGSASSRPPLLVVKVNRRFDDPAGGRTRGFLMVVDATDGRPLALMDSAEITRVRTAAAVAVATRRLARSDVDTMLVVGSGQLSACVVEGTLLARPLNKVELWSRDHAHADHAAAAVSARFGIGAVVAEDLSEAASRATLIVTITASRAALLRVADIRPGAFIAALGADGPGKQELAPDLVAAARVVVDSVDQAVAYGELGHAVREGLMTVAQVHAELAEVVANQRPGRTDDDEIILFDSTGTAAQDVAAATLVLERARNRGVGTRIPMD